MCSVLLFSYFVLFLVNACWLSEGPSASNNQQPANFTEELSEGKCHRKQDKFNVIYLSFSRFQYDKPTVDYFQRTSFCIPKRGSSNLFLVCFPWRNSPIRSWVEVSGPHTDTPHSGRLLWTSDQPVAESLTYASHNEHKRRTSMPSADSNSLYQQSRSRLTL